MKNPIQHELTRSLSPLLDESRGRPVRRPILGRLISSATVASIALASNAAAQFVSPTAVPQFAPPTAIPWGPGGDSPLLNSGDLDGDGDVDVVGSTWGAIYWLENLSGQGDFGPAGLVDTGAGGLGVVVSDLDLDGDQDLVSFGSWDGIRWHENLDGKGTFGPGQPVGTGPTLGVWNLIASDLDADGDPDLIGVWGLRDVAVWFENDGLGGFDVGNPVATLALDAMPYGVDAADLDGDADLDVLLTLCGAGLAVWFENLDGLGTFGPQRTIAHLADDAHSIRSGDLDGDGDPDVLTASGFANIEVVEWHENLDGAGIFATAAVLVGDGNDMMVADLDCDGDLDVLSSKDAHNGWIPLQWSIAWHENVDGVGTYETHYLVAGSGVLSLSVDAHAADLDGDGDLDVLASADAPTVLPGPLVRYQNQGCW